MKKNFHKLEKIQKKNGILAKSLKSTLYIAKFRLPLFLTKRKSKMAKWQKNTDKYGIFAIFSAKMPFLKKKWHTKMADDLTLRLAKNEKWGVIDDNLEKILAQVFTTYINLFCNRFEKVGLIIILMCPFYFLAKVSTHPLPHPLYNTHLPSRGGPPAYIYSIYWLRLNKKSYTYYDYIYRRSCPPAIKTRPYNAQGSI